MYISENTRQTYTEIDNFIELLDEYNKNKIPIKLRELFKIEKDKHYIKNINPNKPIDEQNLKEETLALIAMLNLQYWCEDEKEKARLKQVYLNNEKKYQEGLIEKYNPDDIFKKKKEKKKENKLEETAITVVQEEKWYQKIFNIIRRLFKRK